MTRIPAYQKAVRYLITIIALIALVSACQKQSLETTATITFACSNEEQSQYRKLAEAFHEENPSITVQIVPDNAVFGDNVDDLQELAASADSFIFWRSLMPQDFQSGLLRDLQPFIEADAKFHAEDFYPGLLEPFRLKGGTWGLPRHVYVRVVFFDKAAFDEAGLPYPQPPALSGAEGGWGFEEFETAAKRLTKRQGEETLRFGLVVPLGDSASGILVLGRAQGWADGITVLSDPILDSRAVAEAAQWYVDLARVQGVMPNPPDLAEEQTSLDWVMEGKAAMWTGVLSAYALETYERLYDVGIVPLPEGTPISEWVIGSAYLMSAGTAHPDEVWQWLHFLTYQPGDVGDVRPPVRRSVAEETGYWEALGSDLAPTVRYIMERPKVTLPPGMVKSLTTALQTILTEGQDVQETLAQAQRELVETLGMPVGQAIPPVPTPRQAEASITYCSVAYPVEPYRKLAAAFQEVRPDINVFVVRPDQISFEHYAKNCACFDYPLAPYQLSHPEDRELIFNLQPLVDADLNLPGDFYPGVLELGRWENELWALPAEVDFKVVRYNKDIFDQAGVTYPQSGWTPEDFREKAVALTRGEGKDKIYGYMPGLAYPEIDDFDFFVEQRGGYGEYRGIEAEALPPWLASLETSEVMAAVRWYTDLVLVDGAIPRFPHASEPGGIKGITQRYELVADGRVAMWTEFLGFSYVTLDFPVGTAPLPLGRGLMRHQHIVGYMISAWNTQPQACWAWIKFLLEQPAAAVRGAPARRTFLERPEFLEQAIKTVPSDPEFFENPEFVEEVKEEILTTYRFSLEHMDSVPYWTNSWLRQAFEAIMDGTPVETAVEEALRKDATFSACLNRVPGPLQEEDLEACGKEAESLSP